MGLGTADAGDSDWSLHGDRWLLHHDRVAEIVQMLVSPVQRYVGRPGPLSAPLPDDTVERVEIRAGLGVVGDRYFNRPAHRDASVTVIAAESLAPWPGTDLRQTRRNILLRGFAVDGPAGRVLSLDTGDGPVLLLVRRAANPCAWLDVRVGSGAWKALRGHGGVRCEPLTDGVLRVGPVVAEWLEHGPVLAKIGSHDRRNAKSAS